MEEITNEQKLYVLLDNARRKTEAEKEIWGIISSYVSVDGKPYEDVATLLVDCDYMKRGYGFNGKEPRVVYSITEKGRNHDPVLWNGSDLRRKRMEELKALKEES